MWAARSRGFVVNPVMTQDEARRRLKAMIDALPESERQQWQDREQRVGVVLRTAESDPGEPTRH